MPKIKEVYVDHVAEIIKLSSEMIRKNDQINQRLVTAIMVLAISFSICLTITLVGISYCYFNMDYSYPQVNQNQTNTENSNQTFNKGVK